MVSTHSRPKAAGRHRLPRPHQRSFNTQPPEGGCRNSQAQASKAKFQHTAARRRLQYPYCVAQAQRVSTHSRPKAAGAYFFELFSRVLFQHTAARRRLYHHITDVDLCGVSTHSRPKAAGRPRQNRTYQCRFNTQPPEGGCYLFHKHEQTDWFQHTAARRRLALKNSTDKSKASFNTQPPEGGCQIMG